MKSQSKSLMTVWLYIAAFVVFLVVNVIVSKGITAVVVIRFFIFAVATAVVVTLHKKGKLAK